MWGFFLWAKGKSNLLKKPTLLEKSCFENLDSMSSHWRKDKNVLLFLNKCLDFTVWKIETIFVFAPMAWHRV